MKTILCFITAALFTIGGMAQNNDTTQIGKIVYYEGLVQLGAGNSWAKVKLNTPVKRNQNIKTSTDAMAEVQWNNGVKSIVGPGSDLSAASLFSASGNSPKQATDGLFSAVKSKMNAETEAKRKEVGGIRRTEVDAKQKGEGGEVYWKEDKEIVFDEAYSFYEKREFNKAIAALQAFIHQKPMDPMVKYAWFALGHSYIMENNPLKAKEIFERFVTQYPTDSLKEDAAAILQKL